LYISHKNTWILGGTFKCQTAGLKIDVIPLKFRTEYRECTEYLPFKELYFKIIATSSSMRVMLLAI
jgi:hypothetical protein